MSFFFFRRRELVTTLTLEGHRGARYHRVEQKAKGRVKDSGGNGDSYYIIYECPEKVLSDGAHRQTREAQGLRNLSEVGGDDGHVRHFHRYVRACAHRD